MVHGPEHFTECSGIARHLEADVEALLHVEILHGLIQRLARDIHRARGPQLARQVESIVVYVRDDHIARADKACDRDGHDADRARAGDQHILAHHAEGEGGVSGVTERIENRGDVIANGVGQLEGVVGRNRKILGERARTIHSDTNRVTA